ncbi:uncharacterized protein B0H64DRAFT_442348 [Chaetomium fimeti]|uniref:Uncharacterized protein n=1 Tax=Chaetomium fimeti TaxID=1854472 RepID=A0AAE0HGF1_9PEZI|nr:hypothetical protein B0H64DRAFT_442348 [Chaetomium fimeti]
MSADLFALFGDAPETADPQQTQQTQTQGIPNNTSTTAAPAASDPFSFISSASSTLPPQNAQQTAQWPPFQQTTTGQSASWLTSPVSEPQTSNAWGDIGSLGGLGNFQSQATALPISQKPVPAEEDDDGWGDFEVAPTSPPTQPPMPTTVSNPPRAQVTRMPTIDMMTNKLVDLNLDSSAPEPYGQQPSWEDSSKTQQPQKPVRNPDPNVLFDADFEVEHGADDDDDDFGDFETGTPATAIPPQIAPPKSAVDLLSLDPDPVPAAAVSTKKQPPGLTLSNTALQANEASYPEVPKSPYGSFQNRKPEPVKQLQVKPPTLAKALQGSSAASLSAIQDDDFGDNWEEFENIPDPKPTTAKPKPKAASKTKPTPKPPADAAVAPEWEWQDWGGQDDQPSPPTTTTTAKAKTTTTKPKTTTTTSTTTQPPQEEPPSPKGPPPTNIPPPAILLSLFPTLLDLASTTLLKPLLTLPTTSPAHQRVLAAPATLTFLRGYLALARVAARLIAGRKPRWHRDRFLAQGMSISAVPAGGGGQRGMKLAGVDKGRAAHDDREAAEVAAVWKRQVGRLRSVVAGVAAAHSGEGVVGLRVPEVAVGLAVATAKGVPTAPRACVVCGLRRDERVAKVDGEVEDSFGEWWVEFWGHRECRNFWVGHESELRSR